MTQRNTLHVGEVVTLPRSKKEWKILAKFTMENGDTGWVASNLKEMIGQHPLYEHCIFFINSDGQIAQHI